MTFHYFLIFTLYYVTFVFLECRLHFKVSSNYISSTFFISTLPLSSIFRYTVSQALNLVFHFLYYFGFILWRKFTSIVLILFVLFY